MTIRWVDRHIKRDFHSFLHENQYCQRNTRESTIFEVLLYKYCERMFSVYAAHYYYCIVFVSYVVFLLNFDNPFSSVICPAADAGLLPFPIMKIWLGFHSQNSQYSIHTLSKAGQGWMRNGRHNNALEVELYL